MKRFLKTLAYFVIVYLCIGLAVSGTLTYIFGPGNATWFFFHTILVWPYILVLMLVLAHAG